MQATSQITPAMNATAGAAPRTGSATAATTAPRRRRVIDAPTRMFHWLFALSFLGAYVTADGEHWRLVHVTLGYTMAGLLVARLLYGLFGPRQAGLGMLWHKITAGGAWLRSLTRVKSLAATQWRQGQNLLMALAIVALLAMVVPLTLSGYASYNDWGGSLGGEWLEELHEFFGEAFLFVVLAHLALIAGVSLLRRKNQAQPMLTGHVDGPGPNLVQNNRSWLAALLLIAVLAFWVWEWQQTPGAPAWVKALPALMA
ncbi:MAG: cytochrome b/b6 domain-containing protein [Burkholderiaceae bacterium]|nr:cytochrome b/b6 domain-containing protein [Burkholderiaceae bacterium]